MKRILLKAVLCMATLALVKPASASLPINTLSPPAMYGVTDIGYVTAVPEPMSFGLAAALIGLFCFGRSRRSLQLILNLGFLVSVLVLIRAIATITSIARGWLMPMTAARHAV